MARVMGHVKDVMSDKFTWHVGVGSAEASDLPAGLITTIYNDACDAGFIVTSKRTGRKMLYTLHKEHGEEDITYWEFHCYAEVFTTGGGGRNARHIYDDDFCGVKRPTIILVWND